MDEWAGTADDVLFRRTKLGLKIGSAEADALDEYMRARLTDRSAAAG